jgi:glutathione S-transferase
VAKLELLHFPGACSRVTWIALEETGAPYKARMIRVPKGELTSAEFLAINPKGQIPVLLVDDVPMTENIAILWYLAELFPQAGLLPASTAQRAKALSRISLCVSELHPIVTRLIMPAKFCDTAEGAQRVWALSKAAMDRRLETVEQMFDGRNWAVGDGWSIADGYFYWIQMALRRMDYDLSSFPAFAAHYDRVLARESVARVVELERNAYLDAVKDGFQMPKGLHYL